jgi:hypothetical protein
MMTPSMGQLYSIYGDMLKRNYRVFNIGMSDSGICTVTLIDHTGFIMKKYSYLPRYKTWVNLVSLQ